MNKDYPIMYGSMRGALTSLAYNYTIPGVEIKDPEMFRKWLAQKAEDTDAYAVALAEKINGKSS
jgi:trehalose-6-phosphatase